MKKYEYITIEKNFLHHATYAVYPYTNELRKAFEKSEFHVEDCGSSGKIYGSLIPFNIFGELGYELKAVYSEKTEFHEGYGGSKCYYPHCYFIFQREKQESIFEDENELSEEDDDEIHLTYSDEAIEQFFASFKNEAEDEKDLED